MALFRRRKWNLKDVPALRFQDGSTRVDIGFLGGEEHRQAFASIFEKMLADNKHMLAPYAIEALRAKKRIPVEVPESSITGLGEQTRLLALALYDSRNDEVVLELRSPSGRAELGVRFDDPEFWLQVAAV